MGPNLSFASTMLPRVSCPVPEAHQPSPSWLRKIVYEPVPSSSSSGLMMVVVVEFRGSLPFASVVVRGTSSEDPNVFEIIGVFAVERGEKR